MVVTAGSLAEFLDVARRRVDEALEQWLPSPPVCPPIVSDAMRYSVFAGGKRFRPVVTLAAADAVSGRTKGLPHKHPADLSDVAQDLSPAVQLALPAACAIEMIHTYSLIHDDLPAMDNDTLRRGRPTLHVAFGEGIAILAGDGLLAEAFALLGREPRSDDPEIVRRKLRVISFVGEAAGCTGMVGGQAIDLQAAGQAPGHTLTLDGDGLRAMHARKTGALIRASAVSGAIIAGAPDDVIDAIDRYAIEVGLGFQIVDDILDVEGESAQLGKTAGKDAASEKPTYPKLFGLERSRELAAECLARARQILADAGLENSQLPAIAEWVVRRRN